MSRCVEKGPKATVELEVAGVLGAEGPGQLPCSERQVTNIIRREKSKGGYATGKGDVIMQQAHSDGSMSQFIRAIGATPDPAIVLAEDCQIKDMVCFCTSSSTSEFCILTIDPTFSLGEFDVTPITYRHMLLETKRSGTHPIFVGPLLIHYWKTFSVFFVCIVTCWNVP